MIDLRSDTVTLPTEKMKAAMFSAPVGDDVYGEDPTVIELQNKVVALTEKEAALFAPSGTQSNLLAIMSHCQRGDEYIVGQDAHTYKYEGGGAAILGSVQPQPIEFNDFGYMPIEAIEGKIKPKDPHFATTKLICLENTVHGQCLPLDYATQVRSICEKYNLNLHLDGARLFNAAVKQDQTIASLTKDFDSVSLCLSKGLGAPVGSVLVGSKELIEKAKRWRKVLGGGMRQAGFLAAAGIYALDNHVERLAEDHRRARLLSEELSSLPWLRVSDHSGKTNMVFISMDESSANRLHSSAEDAEIKLPSGQSLRLVMHLNISDSDLEKVIELFKSI